jgi:2-aminoethylphosphonate transport system substrate-binding protein
VKKFLAPLAALVLALAAACGGTAATPGSTAPSSGGKTVTLYSADGLGDWYKTQFAAFTQATGIAVNYVEAGSAEVVSRVEKEQSNPQADVIVTLPPFIQKAGADGMLQLSGVDTTGIAADDKAADGSYVSLMNNYLSFIYNPTAASPAPSSFKDLLDPRFAGKIQYSTPGQAGDGTAVLLLLQQVYGKQGALDYLAKLQPSTIGPSSSTGKLQPKVSKGEIAVANGDLQMNTASIRDDKSNFKIFFPSADDGNRSTLALPYVMGLAKGAPQTDAGKQLMTFLLSAPVQKTIAAEALGISPRTDLPADEAATQIAQTMQGVKIIHPDWTGVLRDLDGDIVAYNKATGQ